MLVVCHVWSLLCDLPCDLTSYCRAGAPHIHLTPTPVKQMTGAAHVYAVKSLEEIKRVLWVVLVSNTPSEARDVTL